MRRVHEAYRGATFVFDTKMSEFHNQTMELFLPEWDWLLREHLVSHMHINDYNGGYMDWSNLRTLPVGAGKIDFTGFFDNLNHEYLKARWCNLLGVEYLPNDHYAVFKNITKYSKWELSDIYKINGLENNNSGWKQLNSMNRVLSKKQFQDNRSQITKNTNPFGIPQGSPISAILANLYMIDIDKIIHDIVKSIGGIYMRYSDDFIIVIPQSNPNFSMNVINKINCIFNSIDGLTLEPSKTQYYIFSDGQIINCGQQFTNKNNINYW